MCVCGQEERKRPMIRVYDRRKVRMLAKVVIFLNEGDYSTEFFFIGWIFALGDVPWSGIICNRDLHERLTFRAFGEDIRTCEHNKKLFLFDVSILV